MDTEKQATRSKGLHPPLDCGDVSRYKAAELTRETPQVGAFARMRRWIDVFIVLCGLVIAAATFALWITGS